MATVDDVVLRAVIRQEVTRGLDEIIAQLQLLNRTQAATQRQSRQTARGLDNIGDQAKQAARRITSMTTAVLGLNAAMNGTRGLGASIRGIQGETKILIGLFATLIPAAVPVAATLTASFLSLGSAMATVVASAGVLALGFSGIGDAVSALAGGDLDKINEAFANLAPAGQAFAQALFDLKPVLDTLRGTAQEALLPGVQQALQILSTLLPVINPLVAVLGQALGQAALQVASFATSPGFTSFIQFITDNAGQIQTITGQFLDFTQAVLDLTVAFGPLTDTTLAGIGSLIDSFARFASGASGTLGAFLGYVEQAMPHVNDFFNTFGTVLIQLLTDLSGPGLVVLDALTGILDVIGDLSPTVGDLAQAIGVSLLGVVGALTPIIEQLGPILGDVLVAAATALADTLIALAPTIGQIAAFIGDQLLSAVQTLAPYLPTLGAAFLGVLTALEPLLPLIVSLIPVLGDTLLVIFQTLTPVISQLVTGVEPLVAGVGALLAALTPLIPVLGDALLQILQAIVPVLPSLVDGFLQVVNALIPLVPVMLDLVLAVVPLVPPLLELVTSILPLLAVTIGLVTPLITRLADSMSLVLTPVIDGISKSFEGLVYLIEKLVGYLNGGFIDDISSLGKTVGKFLLPGNPIGDTGAAHGSGNLASTMGAHASVMGAIGSGVGISNALIGGGGHGRGSGDHQAGRALDIVGPRMGAYAAAARAQGHYAALHGSGAGRHAHVAFRRPMGDTGTSMAPRGAASTAVSADGFGGVTVNLNVGGNVIGLDNIQALIDSGYREALRQDAARRRTA